ncbi:phage tail tube protein [Pseudomonas sp.]|uniref:phage tail tube protein n=1 Tax=Pseudomonas sp. TaxID=306 RepID=UPI003340F655
MAVMVGSAASFKIAANTVAEMDQWSLDVQTGLEETQAFGDTWKERTATIKEWSGSASGRFDDTDTNGHVALSSAFVGGTSVAARFYVDGTNYYSGTAFVQASLSASENGLVTVNYTFTGTGALTLT